MAGVLDLTVDLGQSPREARADSESRTFAYTVSLSDWPKQKDKQKDKSPKVRGASASTASTSTSTPPSPRGGKSPKTKAYWLPPENPEGPVEYKLKLSDVPPARFEHLVTQLKFRLAESGGEGACTYLLGVEDRGFCRGLPPNDLKATLATLYAMCASLTGVKETVASAEDFLADVAGTLEEEKTTATDLFTMRVVCKEGREGKYCRADIKLIPKQHAYSYTELRVAMCGAHDAGKSTLMSVLTHGEHRKPLLCNGMGQARSRVFTHKHEVESGRTSSIGYESLAYGKHGICLNYQTTSACWPLTPVEMSREAGKMLRLFDLSGHERYLKTTCYGMTCLVPDFVMLTISAQEGVSEMTREHAALARALGAPIFVVLTKTDLIGQNQAKGETKGEGEGESEMERVLGEVRDLVGEHGEVIHVKTIALARESGKKLGKHTAAAVVPVLGVSCVSGAGLDLLHEFLKKLRPRDYRRKSNGAPPGPLGDASSDSEHRQDLLHFQVHKTFEVPSVGPVLFGTMLSGKIKVGYQLLLGPMEDGSFSPVRVKSIQRSQVPVSKLTAGQTGTLAFFGRENVEARGAEEGDPPPSLAPRSLSINIPQGRAAGPGGGGLGGGGSHGSPSSLGASPKRKGTVLLSGDGKLAPFTALRFRAICKMAVSGQSGEIAGADGTIEREETFGVHCGSIRQAAMVVSCKALAACAGEEAGGAGAEDFDPVISFESKEDEVFGAPMVMDFKFLHWAEWMNKGSKLVLRNLNTGRLGGVGFVVEETQQEY